MIVAAKREWLILLRNKQNKTQQSVADGANIDRSTYACIESGKRGPSVTVAKAIGNALEFDWTIFFDSKSGIVPQKEKSA